MSVHRILLPLAALVSIAAIVPVHAQPYEHGVSYPTADAFHPPVRQPSAGCGRLDREVGAIGPVDYRTVSPYTISFVEIRHFDRGVETLKKGIKSTVAGDIAYTLRAFPNHPRALRSVWELQRRNGGVTPPDLGYSAECWFDRAIAFRPDDIDVRIVYSFELIRDGRIEEARPHVLHAEKLIDALTTPNPRWNYNIGLLLHELKQYDRALAHAHKAYQLGFDLPGLRNKLKTSGHWRDG